jgi:rap GTPase-activating protein, putative (fragment)
MLNQLENYYWRYNSASQLVNAILKFMDPRVNKFFSRTEFLTLSESMITSILTRPGINLTEIRKFEIMHQWALNKVINDGQSISESTESVTNGQLSPNKFKELKATMNRLTRDLKFHKIPPQDLIKVSVSQSVARLISSIMTIILYYLQKVVLPSKTITHERILATLLYQADAGIYCQPNYAQFGS